MFRTRRIEALPVTALVCSISAARSNVSAELPGLVGAHSTYLLDACVTCLSDVE
jgi:hypothetical protein